MIYICKVNYFLSLNTKIIKKYETINKINSPKDFLLNESFGPYTCTYLNWNTKRLTQEAFHLQRLVGGYEHESNIKSIKSKEKLKVITKSLLDEFINGIINQNNDEYMNQLVITILYNNIEQDNLKISFFSSVHNNKIDLNKSNTLLVNTNLMIQRQNPTIKHSSWLKERLYADNWKKEIQEKNPNFNIIDVLLHYKSSDFHSERTTFEILEGLITNFFIITKAKTIQTAEQNRILNGSIQSLIIQEAKDLGIPIIFIAPEIEKQHEWAIAFVTSSLRYITQIDQIYVQENEGHYLKIIGDVRDDSQYNKIFHQIKERVMAKIKYDNT